MFPFRFHLANMVVFLFILLEVLAGQEEVGCTFFSTPTHKGKQGKATTTVFYPQERRVSLSSRFVDF